MLRLLPILALAVAVDTQELLGVKYSFDVDFSRTFNNKGCDDRSVWGLASYETLEIEAPFVDSDKGIIAATNSCATSFPIAFFQGTLEFNVYASVISKEYRLIIEVFNDQDVSIARYAYGRSSEGFKPGWCTISLKIDQHTTGYINIRGHSLINEIVLIDSFIYKPNDTISNDKTNGAIQNALDNNDEDENEDEIIFNYVSRTNEDDIGFLEVGSGDPGSGYEDTTTTEEPEPEQPIQSFWTPLSISLVSIGAIVGLGTIVVGAYQFGRVRGMDQAPILVEDIDPPRTLTIPRVTGVYGSSFLSYD